MGKSTTKHELVRSVFYEQDKSDPERIQKYILEDVFDIFVENIKDALVSGEYVYLRGFGTFAPIRENLRRRTRYVPGPDKIVDTIVLNHHRIFKPSRELIRKVNVGASDVFQRYFDNSNDS